MNPYKEIARRHLTVEDLEELLAERKGPAPETMNSDQEQRAMIRKRIQKLF